MILVLNCGSQSVKWKLFNENLKLEKEGKKEIFNSGRYKKILIIELIQLSKDLMIWLRCIILLTFWG